MATLIPSISTCASRMTSGERHVAQRLEDKLDDDYLLWYDVPMGPKNAHPDFCVIALERDPQLVQPEGPHAGKLAFPWSYGAVFTNITRKQFEAAELLTADDKDNDGIPLRKLSSCGRENPAADVIQIMTMKVSKGLEFPVVALPGVGHMSAKGEDEQEAARVLYVAATRATQRLVIGISGDGGFEEKLG